MNDEDDEDDEGDDDDDGDDDGGKSPLVPAPSTEDGLTPGWEKTKRRCK